MGPGTLKISGPEGSNIIGTIGTDTSGIVYTELGFATPFINIGPEISPITGALGGYRLLPLVEGTDFDLVAQQIDPDGGGLIGDQYSLIKHRPEGPQGYTGPQGDT